MRIDGDSCSKRHVATSCGSTRRDCFLHVPSEFVRTLFAVSGMAIGEGHVATLTAKQIRKNPAKPVIQNRIKRTGRLQDAGKPAMAFLRSKMLALFFKITKSESRNSKQASDRKGDPSDEGPGNA